MEFTEIVLNRRSGDKQTGLTGVPTGSGNPHCSSSGVPHRRPTTRCVGIAVGLSHSYETGRTKRSGPHDSGYYTRERLILLQLIKFTRNKIALIRLHWPLKLPSECYIKFGGRLICSIMRITSTEIMVKKTHRSYQSPIDL